MLDAPMKLLTSVKSSAGRRVLDLTRVSPDILVDYSKSVREAPVSAGVGSVWTEYQNEILREAFESGSLKPDFLRTKRLSHSVSPSQYRIGQRIVDHLKRDPFGQKLLLMLTESPFGEPFLLPKYPLLSSVGAQNIFYVFLLKRLLSLDVFDYEGDFADFGGGYGYFSRALMMLNDVANVHILDLPVQLLVQRAFHETTLTRARYSRISYHDAPLVQSNTEKLSELQTWLCRPFHFNATFSLSECNEEIQSFFLEKVVSRSRTFMIVYASEFRGVDNKSIYESVLPKSCKDHKISYHNWEEYPYGNIVIGVRK